MTERSGGAASARARVAGTGVAGTGAAGPGVAGALLVALLATACGEPGAEPSLFELVPPEESGVAFVNDVPDDGDINILNYLNYYNGGGVAVGDVDGNGLPDLYFTANLGPNRLYLNRGGFRFEDVTDAAGVAGGPGWTTGATMADVNGDGHLDLYVSAVRHRGLPGGNILYVNRGDGAFEDRTREYGLEHVGYSTQAAFFDYDADGDLDMYLLNHSVHEERGPSRAPQRTPRHPRAGDRLFRNDGGRFADVSEEAGIHGGVEGYGLGVVASDFDLDGCIDLFVANDFQENDFLYRNDCDGTFTESIATAMGHTSRSSMGVDAADYDNDGRPDLVVLDMLPEREEILKTSAGAESYEVDARKRRAGYHPQYSRNTLQLNRGGGRFSEIGQLAGVHATDWSWAPLFADLDNDGRKDLFVTNGIYRRPNDMDYLTHVVQPSVQASLAGDMGRGHLGLIERMPHVPIPNHAFRNLGDHTFADVAREWGLAQPGFSTGAAYADLDGSGALDLVVNAINAPAAIYRNRAREINGHRYLAVRLDGEGANTAGIGARVVLHHDGRVQMLEQMPTRGFQSSVEPRLHFGLGATGGVDSLLVAWPDGRQQRLVDVPVDTTLVLVQAEASRAGDGRDGRPSLADDAASPPGPRLFTDLTDSVGIAYRHEENLFFDFTGQPLIPHRLSTEGPALAVADVDGDGLDDLYVGGAKWQPGRLLLQRPDGTFGGVDQGSFRADSLHEDVDATFFDADGDGDPDLYVVSGGNEFWGSQEPLRDRLYLNDGRGAFERDPDALPAIFENGGCVARADFDADGDTDLFVGGRVVAREYGRAPRSVLLRNDGTGRFTDVTRELAPALAEVGMVTSAAWLDGGGDVDDGPQLVVVGEWMPVRIFAHRDGRFVERTAEAGLSGTAGWWNSVTAADLDGDGREDLVLGNLGLNSYLRASGEAPVRLYVHDFSGNGRVEAILTSQRDGASYPLAGRDELVRAIPALREKYPTYASFGASRIEDIFSPAELRRAHVLEARTFASSVAFGGEDGAFRIHPLPLLAQLAPVHAALAEDFDGDGRTDVLVAGNFDGAAPALGRYDASYGLLLRGADDGRLEPVDAAESGVVIEGDVRALASLRGPGGGRLVVAARNGDGLALFRVDRPTPAAPRTGDGATAGAERPGVARSGGDALGGGARTAGGGLPAPRP